MLTAGPRTAVILCGGRGTRLQEHTRSIPKPLVEIGGRPILWHVIEIYVAQGFRRIVLCLGYKAELIEESVAAAAWPADVEIACIDTGLDTPTGGRVKLAADQLGPGAFHVTYADGVADIDLARLSAHHRAHGKLATMTVVRPQLPFGVAELGSGGEIRDFHEKPRSEHWINGGFLCLEREAIDYLDAHSVLEREPMQRLAADGQLHAFRHEGFWDCMDTYKDALFLNDLWAKGTAPWIVREPAVR